MPAGSIVKILDFKKPSQVGDEMLVLIDMAAKARIQVAAFVADLLLKHYPKQKAAELATILSEGRWTHDFPIMVDGARQLGLKVSTENAANGLRPHGLISAGRRAAGRQCFTCRCAGQAKIKGNRQK